MLMRPLIVVFLALQLVPLPAEADCAADLQQAEHQLPNITDQRARLDAERKLDIARRASEAQNESECQTLLRSANEQLRGVNDRPRPRPLGMPTDLRGDFNR
jgi:hypothetical protein